MDIGKLRDIFSPRQVCDENADVILNLKLKYWAPGTLEPAWIVIWITPKEGFLKNSGG